jgi:hypothetical protein
LASSSNSANDGLVGSGPNWIERSFPVNTPGEQLDPKTVDDYNLGVSGAQYMVGPLSKSMYTAIVSKSRIDEVSVEIQRAYKLYSMDFTAKEAVRAALEQNGLQMVLLEEDQDEGLWGNIDSIRVYDDQGKVSSFYDSWEDAVDHWTPGQTFDFVARQVPAKMKELSMKEVLKALGNTTAWE